MNLLRGWRRRISRGGRLEIEKFEMGKLED
jgi:hypothetical protein